MTPTKLDTARASRIGSQTLISRRDLLQMSGLGIIGASVSGWFPLLADDAAVDPRRKRQCILLWMTGGPSQMDTFDLKPGHVNGGPFREIASSAPGLFISEHLPKIARHGSRLAVVRGLSTKEGDHGRGTFLMRTGHQPGGPIQYPTLGSSYSKELGNESAELPNYVSIAPYRLFNRAAFQPGFLGPGYAPLTVGAADNFNVQAQTPQAQTDAYASLSVDDLASIEGIAGARGNARHELWRQFQADFVAHHRTAPVVAHNTVYERAVRMMGSEAARAFNLSGESAKVRSAYGRSRFGQGCLMARRLIEHGVPFVEVSLGGFGGGALGWDTHQNNFDAVKNLSAELDAGWGTLMSELAERGLLDSTTILWMGEFGRTPKINQANGRDHFPNAWTCVLAGGGIKGGQAFGRTSDDGATVEDGKVDVGDVLSTLAKALGIDPRKQNVSEVGRPIRIAEGTPIRELLG